MPDVMVRGLYRASSDAGLISSGTVSFASGDDLTTEKRTSAISVGEMPLHQDQMFYLAVEKPSDDTAGDLTVSTYNLVKFGSNVREVLHTTHTVDMVSGQASYRGFLIQGLFVGEGQVKLGFKFAADSGAIDVLWKLYRL